MINYIICILTVSAVVYITGSAVSLRLGGGGRARSILTGLMFYFALFEVTALPFMLSHGSLSHLTIVFVCLSGLCTALSIIYLARTKSFGELVPARFRPDAVWILVFCAVGAIAAYVAVYGLTDVDDTFYIATVNAALSSGRIFAFEPSMGLSEFVYPSTYTITGFEMLYAVLCSLFGLEPAVLCHGVIPALMIPLSYLALYFLSERLFDKSRDRALFLLAYAFIMCFSKNSGYYPTSFLIMRSWQGKCVMINVIWPVFLAFFLDACRESGRRQNEAFVLIVLTLVAGVFCSTIGVYLIPVSFGCLTLARMITDRDWKFFGKCCIAAVPSAAFLILDLIVLARGGGFGEIAGLEFTQSWLEVFRLFFRENLLYPVLGLLALCFFAYRGSKDEKLLFVVYPLVLLLTFLNPLLYRFVARYLTGIPLYWRLIWLLPTFIAVAAGTVRLLGALKGRWKIAAVIPGLAMILFGTFSFQYDWFDTSANPMKIASNVVEAADIMESREDTVVLADYSYNRYIRQLTGDVKLAWTKNSYVQEAYARAGRSGDYELLKTQYEILNEEKEDQLDVAVLQKLGINAVISKRERPELNGWDEVKLSSGDILYFEKSA